MESKLIHFNDTEVAFAYKATKQLKWSRFVFAVMGYPWMVKLGMSLIHLALKIHFPVRNIIKKTLFNQFCGGESIQDCEKTIKLLGNRNVHTILNYSIEGIESEDGYNEVMLEAFRIVDFSTMADYVPFCVLKLSGLGSTYLMNKAQRDETLSEEEKTKLNHFEQRVIKIAQKVHDQGIMMMIDAEESWIQGFIDGVSERLMERFNKTRPVVFNTYQLYRTDAFNQLQLALKKATDDGYYLGAKLVRGAYMEKERKRAREMGYVSPIHPNKVAVDKDYDAAIRFCVQHIGRMGLCSGTHNEKSVRHLAELMEENGLEKNDSRIYFAQLLGMSDHISFLLSKRGYNVAKFVPYGPVRKVLPYLFRRAEENTSIAGQSGREYLLIQKELKRRKNKKQ